jgi:hypothetical protein
MSAVRTLPPSVCPCTPGCTGTGDHVCTVLRPTPRPPSPEDAAIHREIVREQLRARWRVTI